MGWFSGLIGGGSSVVEPVVAIGNVIDKLFTSDDERAAGELLKQTASGLATSNIAVRGYDGTDYSNARFSRIAYSREAKRRI